MNIVVLGLSLSSSWGNGHAVTYRALLRAFADRGHGVLFLERDVPWYAAQRDLTDPAWCELAFYQDLADLRRWSARLAAADAVIVGSYVPEGIVVGRWARQVAHGPVAFYDIDTPVTLAGLTSGATAYLAAEDIADYDVYFSFTGGPTLDRLERDYGSPAARALYCAVDPAAYRPVDTPRRWDLSYLGTYSDDRQPALESFLLACALRAPGQRFVVAGPQYPASIAWPANVERIEHVAPADHPAFYSASRFTLNITRADMAAAGYSPSIRLFEAAACGTAIISDVWEGIDSVFTAGRDIILAHRTCDVMAALALDDAACRALGTAARRRILQSHTAAHRAATLEAELHGAIRRATHETAEQMLTRPDGTALATMRAAVLTGAGCSETVSVERPSPGPGEVRIRLEGCGVCASNLTPWAGPDWMRFPTEPGGLGHEGWGVIDEVGPAVTTLAPGDRVAALSYHSYADYDVAAADAVVRLPAALGDMPFPGEPLGCAMNIFQRSAVMAGHTVAIIGIGFLGALLTRLASTAGARVIAISRRPFSLRVARDMGAHETIAMDDHHAIIEQVRSLTGGVFCDRVIEAVGQQWPLDLAGELTRERGRLVIAGYHQDGPRQVNMQLWNWRGLDVINAHERDPRIYLAGIRAAIAAVIAGRLDPTPLYTHTYRLDQLGMALDATRDRPDGFLKALIIP